MGDREEPLCATVPLPTCITEGYPSSIRSFLFCSPGERSNSAQHAPSSITPLGEWRRLCASSLLLFPGLSPGLHCPAHGGGVHTALYDQERWWDGGIPRVVQEEGYPGWCTSPISQGIYTRVYLSHTQGCTYPACSLLTPGCTYPACSLLTPGCTTGTPLIPTGVQQVPLSYPRVYKGISLLTSGCTRAYPS